MKFEYEPDECGSHIQIGQLKVGDTFIRGCNKPFMVTNDSDNSDYTSYVDLMTGHTDGWRNTVMVRQVKLKLVHDKDRSKEE